MRKYGVWLSYNNQEEGFELPIVPGEISNEGKGDGSGHEVYGLGKINVIKSPNLTEYSLEGIFPAYRIPYVTADTILEPRFYVDLINKWRDTKRPIRFVYVGATMDINTPASIESFTWKESGGDVGNIQYSLGLKEYRFYVARSVNVVRDNNGVIIASEIERPDERLSPKTYTLLLNDNLWTASQRVFGTPDRWQEIKELNGLTDAQLKGPLPGVTLNMPESRNG